MGIRILSSVEKGPRVHVTLLVTMPTEMRDGIPTEVVNSNDKHHRNHRELMKNLGYRWIGGTFSGEIWFRPTDPAMFDNGPRVVVVTYKTIVEAVTDMDRSKPEYQAIIGEPMATLILSSGNSEQEKDACDTL